jgi:hypothetical protein
VAFVGAVGEPPSTTLTALGDPVNVAARLASAAGPGELLVSLDAAHAARFEPDVTERRDLELKGKSDPVAVLVLVLSPSNEPRTLVCHARQQHELKGQRDRARMPRRRSHQGGERFWRARRMA